MIGYLENGKLVHIGEWAEEQDVLVRMEVVERNGREVQEPVYEKQPVPIPNTWIRQESLELDTLPDGGKCLANDYVKLRKESYPIVGDQLDALYKAVKALADGYTIPTDAQTMLDSISNIKTKYPKV